MELNNLKINKASFKIKKRKGRGISSGSGKTCGKGTKGQRARGTGKIRIGFEGGQNPLYRRIPKRGFKSLKIAKNILVVNVSDIEKIKTNSSKTIIDINNFTSKNKEYKQLRILGKGELKKKVIVTANHFSKSAIKKITNAGGKAINI